MSDFALTAPEPRAIEPSTKDIIQQVISAAKGDPTQLAQMAQTVSALVTLAQQDERFAWERAERQARIDFDTALNKCQKQIGRIAPNQKREHGIQWADYAQLDRVLRPIYSAAGFSIGFSEDGITNGQLRMKATLSRGGISRDYFAEISTAPANSGMNALDAKASASSRVKRYLMLAMFNIAIGIDTDEKAPFQAVKPEDLLEESVVLDFIASIEGSSNPDELKQNYLAAANAAVKDPKALRAFDAAKKATWKAKGFRA